MPVDPAARVAAAVQPVECKRFEVPASIGPAMAFTRFGVARFALGDADCELELAIAERPAALHGASLRNNGPAPGAEASSAAIRVSGLAMAGAALSLLNSGRGFRRADVPLMGTPKRLAERVELPGPAGTSRGVFDGDQERALVARHSELAGRIRDQWPRTAAVLRGLASHERDARRLDEEVERRGAGLDD